MGDRDGDNIGRGIALTLAAIFCLDLMGALAKLLSAHYSPVEIVFFRNLIGIVPIWFWYRVREKSWLPRTSHLKGHVTRAALGVTGLLLTFTALSLLPLADATVLIFASPLFLTALSGPLLGEKVGRHRWMAVGLGFSGVLIAAQPSAETTLTGAAVAVSAAFFLALIGINLRKLGRTESAPTVVLYFFGFSALATGLMLPFFWTPPTLETLPLLLAIGLVGAVAQLFLTESYRHAPVSALSPFRYSSILTATALGWLFWRHIPSSHVWAGAAVIVASNLFILWRERRAAGQRGPGSGVTEGDKTSFSACEGSSPLNTASSYADPRK